MVVLEVGAMFSWLPWWTLPAVGTFLALSIAYCVMQCMKPRVMTEFTLPNGMKVWQWQKGETEFLYTEIFKDTLYLRGDLKINKGDTVFDVGANIGMFAMFCNKETEGNVNCYSFEPMPKIHAVCAANAKRFGTNGSLRAFNFGLSDTACDVEFEFHPNFSLWSTADAQFDNDRLGRLNRDIPAILNASDSAIIRMLPNWLLVPMARLFLRKVMHKSEKVATSLRTLSSVVEQEGVTRIDLLKIDVEGHEMEVLRGIKEEHWPMIQQVVMEVETFKLVEEVREILEARGFTVTSEATERAQVKDLTSEVSCVIAVRK